MFMKYRNDIITNTNHSDNHVLCHLYHQISLAQNFRWKWVGCSGDPNTNTNCLNPNLHSFWVFHNHPKAGNDRGAFCNMAYCCTTWVLRTHGFCIVSLQNIFLNWKTVSKRSFILIPHSTFGRRLPQKWTPGKPLAPTIRSKVTPESHIQVLRIFLAKRQTKVTKIKTHIRVFAKLSSVPKWYEVCSCAL